MDIKLNGEVRNCPENCTILQLLDELGLAGKRVAVERNGEIVTRSQHAQVTLQPGDELEVVQAIGGG